MSDAASPEGILNEIAAGILGLETLGRRNSDALDFSEQAAWGLKQALEDALEAGQRASPNTEPQPGYISREHSVRAIALTTLGLETLATRNRDSLDFSNQSVWAIEKALLDAYAEGISAGR
ncbi:DUF6900 domain-containing protein [Cyanobium sp. Morenito 9A2]|uniref:DUF6900 domain-containing protein n=1 Tax=Cyanobium sp. Morenito 9A2 TaxID=2823718 RepID=UPI0020CED522|nr:hypothetical protein [Cyanobium sp. Morenito 9A2]MCP9851043.1 hypothetical protein [Cyanobium sp. Morenito 9A2]